MVSPARHLRVTIPGTSVHLANDVGAGSGLAATVGIVGADGGDYWGRAEHQVPADGVPHSAAHGADQDGNDGDDLLDKWNRLQSVGLQFFFP